MMGTEIFMKHASRIWRGMIDRHLEEGIFGIVLNL